MADGMGGHRGGEVASELAVVVAAVPPRRTSASSPPTRWCRRCSWPTSPSCRRPSDDPELPGMGTTLCAIAVVQVPDEDVERLAIVNVGDSRVYLLKDGELEQVTDDHSLVAVARAPGPAHPGRGRGPPAAQHHHPGPRHRRPGDGRLVGGRARSRATATCSAATGCSTRSRRTASRPRSASWPTPTTRPASWCAWPTRAAAATTSAWSSSTCSTTSSAATDDGARTGR